MQRTGSIGIKYGVKVVECCQRSECSKTGWCFYFLLQIFYTFTKTLSTGNHTLALIEHLNDIFLQLNTLFSTKEKEKQFNLQQLTIDDVCKQVGLKYW